MIKEKYEINIFILLNYYYCRAFHRSPARLLVCKLAFYFFNRLILSFLLLAF